MTRASLYEQIALDAGAWRGEVFGRWWTDRALLIFTDARPVNKTFAFGCFCRPSDCGAMMPSDCPTRRFTVTSATYSPGGLKVRQSILDALSDYELGTLSLPKYTGMCRDLADPERPEGWSVTARSATLAVRVQKRYLDTARRWATPDTWGISPLSIQDGRTIPTTLVGVRDGRVVAAIAGLGPLPGVTREPTPAVTHGQ